jgi:predicted DNA-binding transcriptional regulator AlpA
MPSERDWLSIRDVLAELSFRSRHTLDRLRKSDPTFPAPFRPLGGHPRWTRGAIDRWKEQASEAQTLQEKRA